MLVELRYSCRKRNSCKKDVVFWTPIVRLEATTGIVDVNIIRKTL